MHAGVLNKPTSQTSSQVCTKEPGQYLDGWYSTETVGNPGKKTIDSWKVREAEDVQNDLGIFAADIITSFDARIQKCTKDLQNTLACTDMDMHGHTIRPFIWQRLGNGKVKLVRGEGELEVHWSRRFPKILQLYLLAATHQKSQS